MCILMLCTPPIEGLNMLDCEVELFHLELGCYPRFVSVLLMTGSFSWNPACLPK